MAVALKPAGGRSGRPGARVGGEAGQGGAGPRGQRCRPPVLIDPQRGATEYRGLLIAAT